MMILKDVFNKVQIYIYWELSRLVSTFKKPEELKLLRINWTRVQRSVNVT